MNTIGCDLFYMELIEEYPCSSKDELRRREGHYIRLIGTLNMCIAGRTKQEWKNDNKEHISAQNKRYYEKTTEWKKGKVKCPCGGIYTKCHKSEHFRCAKHREYEESLTNPDILIQKEEKLEETSST